MEEGEFITGLQKEAFETLRFWFLREKRWFPWRESPTPYAVWISEIMLQQTRAEVVIPYFLRWMTCFPTVSCLSKASEEEVLKVWEGLGYYSRARAIKDSAKKIMTDFQGEIPSDSKGLSSLKGIGPYTTNAVLAFAYKQKTAPVDGNVLRVMSRFLGIFESVDLLTTRKMIQEKVEVLLPEKRPYEIAEGLIELGACICFKKPQCLKCPLNTACFAYKNGLKNELPVRSPRKKIQKLNRLVGIIIFQRHLRLLKRGVGEIMQDLYEFPYIEMEGTEVKDSHIEQLEQLIGVPLVQKETCPVFGHSFTHYKVSLHPYIFHSDKEPLVGKGFSLLDAKHLPMSSGHRKILSYLIDNIVL